MFYENLRSEFESLAKQLMLETSISTMRMSMPPQPGPYDNKLTNELWENFKKKKSEMKDGK